MPPPVGAALVAALGDHKGRPYNPDYRTSLSKSINPRLEEGVLANAPDVSPVRRTVNTSRGLPVPGTGRENAESNLADYSTRREWTRFDTSQRLQERDDVRNLVRLEIRLAVQLEGFVAPALHGLGCCLGKQRRATGDLHCAHVAVFSH